MTSFTTLGTNPFSASGQRWLRVPGGQTQMGITQDQPLPCSLALEETLMGETFLEVQRVHGSSQGVQSKSAPKLALEAVSFCPGFVSRPPRSFSALLWSHPIPTSLSLQKTPGPKPWKLPRGGIDALFLLQDSRSEHTVHFKNLVTLHCLSYHGDLTLNLLC